jgi:hypothetical protein
MTVPSEPDFSFSDVLDALFTRIHQGKPAAGTAPPPDMPKVESGSHVASEWFEEEREALAKFTHRQFERLARQQDAVEKQRLEVLQHQQAFNESCFLKQQELNQLRKALTSRLDTLENRERDVADQEKQLAVEEQRLARMREDLQSYRREVAAEEQQLAGRRDEATALLGQAEQLRSEHEEREAALVLKQRELEDARQALDHKQAALEQGATLLAESEAALRQREAEVKELEEVLNREIALKKLQHLRQEIVARTVELSKLKDAEEKANRQLRTIEEAREARRKVWADEQAAWEQRRQGMEVRYLALEQAEAALERRARELDHLEERVRAEVAESEQQMLEQHDELEVVEDESDQPLAAAPD